MATVNIVTVGRLPIDARPTVVVLVWMSPELGVGTQKDDSLAPPMRVLPAPR